MIEKYLNMACEGLTGETCEYCSTRNSRENGFCTQCGAEMKLPLAFVFGVPVYDPYEVYALVQVCPVGLVCI